MQDKQLSLKQENIWNAFVTSNNNFNRHITGEYDIKPFTGSTAILNQLRDTSIYLESKKKTLPFQAYTSIRKLNSQEYQITTYSSSTEIAHLIIKVFVTEAIILLLLLVSIIFLNRKSAGFLWRPFFSTIRAVEEFDITRNNQLLLANHTGTSEFDTLNDVLQQLIGRVNTAYYHQKQFVENASHESQTPLAIIRSKLELMINQPIVSEKNAELLADISEATNRLSQMNRTLLLLAKIENNQFPDTEDVNLSKLLHEILNNFIGFYDDCPEIEINITEHVNVSVNLSLIEMLISNLVNNAFIHNNKEAKIKITLNHTGLFIDNTGDAPTVPTEELFERFKKSVHHPKTTGLGLALVKQISQFYHYTISYTYDNGWHQIALLFRD
jgi:signal transduction histidine kinase